MSPGSATNRSPVQRNLLRTSASRNSRVTLEVSRPFLAYGGENNQVMETLPTISSLERRAVTTQVNHEDSGKMTLSQAELVARLDAGLLTRAQVLRAIAESDEVFQVEFNRAFVAMQYYGYLRRAPEPDGYNAWLTYLNAQPTDFREMVRGFVDSIEYRRRFGTP